MGEVHGFFVLWASGGIMAKKLGSNVKQTLTSEGDGSLGGPGGKRNNTATNHTCNKPAKGNKGSSGKLGG